MSVFDQGGGGGKAGLSETDVSAILSKPYELQGLNQTTLDQINQMFEELYRAIRQTSAEITGQRLLGRYSVKDGPQQEITIGDGLALSTLGVLTASGGEEDDASGGSGITVSTGRLKLLYKRFTLSVAQCNSLQSSPVTVLTGSPNILLKPIFVYKVAVTGATPFSASLNSTFQWDAATPVNASTTFRVVANGANSTYLDLQHTTTGFSNAIDSVGADIRLLGSANPTGGSFTTVPTFDMFYASLNVS